jgi:dTDP-4-amino-4,6-dideoxygalactose transaminase
MKKILRDENLVALACAVGVPVPKARNVKQALVVSMPIPFIENKIYDFERISKLLSLSVSQNHHANGGPVSKLLESMVTHLTRQPAERKVVAVSNGTAALHMACGLHALKAKNNDFRWVTSAFNFFSAHVGSLSNSIVIDCGPNGGFDLSALKALSLDSYDGVVYTNVFAQYSNWCDVADFCAQHGKSFVVDNATGFLDRPKDALKAGSPIEIISAHHTKPWGVGEGGFVLCDAEDEETLRELANFSARLSEGTKFAASNYKISDLSAAAIIDRLERMPSWAPDYAAQQERMHKLLANVSDIMPFVGDTTPQSPRAHVPFLASVPIDVTSVAGPVTLRKYYRPLSGQQPTLNADDLFARIFSLSNSPEMQFAFDEDIRTQLLSLIG